jgi:electron transport complex protein RnfC
MHLMPQRMYQCYEKELFDELDAMNVSDCIECGACSFICPGRLHLTQSFHIGKRRVTQYKKEKGGN